MSKKRGSFSFGHSKTLIQLEQVSLTTLRFIVIELLYDEQLKTKSLGSIVAFFFSLRLK